MLLIDHMEILDGKGVVVSLEGSLNGETSPDFEDYITNLLERGTRYILFDAGDLASVSSAGFGVLILMQKKVSSHGGYVIIFNLGQHLATLFRILGFDRVLNMASTRIEAMETMDRQIELWEERPGSQWESKECVDDDTELPGDDEIPFLDDTFIDETMDDDLGPMIETDEKPDSIQGDYQERGRVEQQRRKVSSPEEGSFAPFVVECKTCQGLVRVRRPGDFLCPSCGTAFKVEDDQTVKY
jgi:anti-anti-sigma factor